MGASRLRLPGRRALLRPIGADGAPAPRSARAGRLSTTRPEPRSTCSACSSAPSRCGRDEAGMANSAPSRSAWLGILRLGLVQTSLGAIVVLMTATINRVMVVELALPAVIPGLLVALFHGVQIMRPAWGHGSDVGGRRAPWIVGGMAALALGGVLAALGDGAGGDLAARRPRRRRARLPARRRRRGRGGHQCAGDARGSGRAAAPRRRGDRRLGDDDFRLRADRAARRPLPRSLFRPPGWLR